jgi:hypothetical protein
MTRGGRRAVTHSRVTVATPGNQLPLPDVMSCHSRVSLGLLHGAYRLSSIDVSVFWLWCFDCKITCDDKWCQPYGSVPEHADGHHLLPVHRQQRLQRHGPSGYVRTWGGEGGLFGAEGRGHARTQAEAFIPPAHLPPNLENSKRCSRQPIANQLTHPTPRQLQVCSRRRRTWCWRSSATTP